MESTPLQPNTIALALETPIDFARSRRWIKIWTIIVTAEIKANKSAIATSHDHT